MESDGERGDSNVGNYAHSMACSLSNLSLESSELGEIWWRERVAEKSRRSQLVATQLFDHNVTLIAQPPSQFDTR